MHVVCSVQTAANGESHDGDRLTRTSVRPYTRRSYDTALPDIPGWDGTEDTL